MSRFLLGAALLAATPALPAQSPLTTNFAGTTSVAGPAMFFFDLTVSSPINITQIDINMTGAASTAGSMSVYTTPNTYVGNDTNPAIWTLQGGGPLTTAGQGQPTQVPLGTGFVLVPGTYGVGIQYVGGGPLYGCCVASTYSNAELTITSGASAAGVLGTAICCTPRDWNGSIHYVPSGSGTVATKSNYGTGCVSVADTCFYENFATSAAFDLSNSAMSLVHTGSGYLAMPGITTYVAPSAAATTLALTDDSETTVALSAPLKVGRTGSTSSLTVCSNGYVSVGTGNGTAYTPVVATFLNAPRTGWWCQHDYNPAIATAGAGRVKFEEVAGIAYVTWDGVWDYGGTTAASANTFQMQFELATGFVHFVWQTMSIAGNARFVGFSEGGTSADPGNLDISATLPATFPAATFAVVPLGLVASARPIIGNSINLDTSNIGSTAPFGAVLLSLSQVNPGTSLTGIGMANCFQYQGGEVTLLFLPFGSPTASTPITVPNAIGIHLYAQSFVYDPAAGLTVLGAVASNGVDLGIGNL